MKVFFDCRMLKMSGIGRYIQNTIVHLSRFSEEVKFLLVGDPGEIFNFVDQNPSLASAMFTSINFRAPIYSFSEQVLGSILVSSWNKKSDLLHFPHYNVPWLLPKNSVITVHDLIHFRFPQFYNGIKVSLAQQVLLNALKKAARVIAVSQATACDLVRMYPSAAEKVRVVYSGVGTFFRPQPEESVCFFKRNKGLGKYILYVGNRKPHKNLCRLVRAYAKVVKSFPDLQLVIAGHRFERKDEVARLAQELGLTRVVEMERVNDEELVYLYCGAEVFILPSLWEGFGLPALEAMACGTPVIVSNTSSLPEVVGEAGIFINPYDEEDIAYNIFRLLSDANLRRKLQEKGYQRAKLFTWEKAACQTWQVYQEVLEESKRRLRP